MKTGDVLAHFSRLGGSELQTPDALPLQVIEVTEPQISGEFQSFAVRLKGPLDRQLEQGMIELIEPDGDSDPLFIVPIARERDGYVYEASFNVRASVSTP